jgi:hypothetical protein
VIDKGGTRFSAIVLTMLFGVSCGGEHHLPSSNPPEYDPTKVYTAPSSTPTQSAPQLAKAEPQTTPPPMTPDALRQALENADRTRAILDMIAGQDPKGEVHAVLEALMMGEQAPPELRPTFRELFEPRKTKILQALDRQYERLHRAIDQQLLPPGVQPPSRRSSRTDSFSLYRTTAQGNPAELLPRVHLLQGSPGITVSLEPDCCGSWHIATIPNGTYDGDSFTVEMKTGGRYLSDKDHVTDSDDSVMEAVHIKVVVEGKATIQVKLLKKNRAVVNRCPSALGVVPGDVIVHEEAGYNVATSATNSQTGIFIHDQAKTVGHTDEEGRVQEIQMEITAADLDGETGQVLRQMSGRAIKKRDRPVSCSGCDLRMAKAAERLARRVSWAYYLAEQQWNNPAYAADACVKIRFTPATKSLALSRGGSTKVKAELRTVSGNEATEGRLFEVQDQYDGTATPKDAKTNSDSPAIFTFTAPQRRWTKPEVPGFLVPNSSSRAGRAPRGEWEVKEGSYILEFQSRVIGSDSIDPAQSHASATIRLELQSDVSAGSSEKYAGVGQIAYKTSPLPNWDACKPLIQGQGYVPIRVHQAFIHEDQPDSTRIELLYSILGLSQETTTGWAYMRNYKCVPNPAEFHPFWSSMYLSGRAEAGASAEKMFTLKNWTYVGRDGVVATKTLRSTCGGECAEEVAIFTLKEMDEGLAQPR